MHNNQGVLDLNIRNLAALLLIGVLWWDIFDSLYFYNLVWFLCLCFYVCVFSWKKLEFSIIKACFLAFPYSLPIIKKKITVSALLFIPSLGCGVMAVHNVIKEEIKQNFFCLHFNPVFSRNSLTTNVLQKYVLEKLNMYIILGWRHILLMSNFG